MNLTGIRHSVFATVSIGKRGTGHSDQHGM